MVVRSECNLPSPDDDACPSRSLACPRPPPCISSTWTFPPSSTKGSSSCRSSTSSLASLRDALPIHLRLERQVASSSWFFLFAVRPCDMLDDPKPSPTSTGRKRPFKPIRRVYVVVNPNEETAGTSTPPFYSTPPLPSTLQHQDKPAPCPPQPSPINTNVPKQKHQPRYNTSDRTVSSPSTPTSSPALESTPPPSTPGQKSIPSIDLAPGSDRDNSQNPLISRTDNFVKKIIAPFSHVRRGSSGNVPPTTTGSVRAVSFDYLRGPPDVCVFSPPSTTITPLLPKLRNLTHVLARRGSS